MNEIEKNLLEEEMDLLTLEDKSEKDELNKSILLSDCSSELVKKSYKSISACKCILSEPINTVVFLGICFMFLGSFVALIYGFVYLNYEGAFIAWIMSGVVFVPTSIIFIYLVKRAYKIYDIYFLKFSNKNYVFYINNKNTILYKNRKEFVCIDNKTKTEKQYDVDEFMNAKLGFGHMVGKMKSKKTKNGYLIKTLDFKNITISRYSGNSFLWLNNEYLPQKMKVGKKYVYKFYCINDKNMKIKIPKEFIQICKEKQINLPSFDYIIE